MCDLATKMLKRAEEDGLPQAHPVRLTAEILCDLDVRFDPNSLCLDNAKIAWFNYTGEIV